MFSLIGLYIFFSFAKKSVLKAKNYFLKLIENDRENVYLRHKGNNVVPNFALVFYLFDPSLMKSL